MDKIVFRNVSKHYKEFYAVHDISFSVKEGETFVIIGTSGCGKTTTLKVINRLIPFTQGKIEIDGKNILEYDPVELRRSIGYVIQSIGLFPHMTIGRNISIVPELMKWPKKKIRSRVNELLSMVGLEPDTYRDRFPADLSGGQQQRIGVARALALDPPIILMDEPFGALDPITREQLQNEFLSLEHQIKKTIIFVTHDIFEAVKIADTLAVMDKGKIVQIGTTRDIIESPANQFVKDFLGKHHFHLSLLLIRLEEFIKKGKADYTDKDIYPPLCPDDTVLDALNYLKKYNLDFVLIKKADDDTPRLIKKTDIRDRIFNSLTK
jgi:osmoprotectant transport system ATP-binding protein